VKIKRRFVNFCLRNAFQSLVALTNVMSSYLAVHEIFKGKPLPNKSSYSFRDMPDTPVVSVLKFRTMFSNIKIFSQSVFIYLYEATVVHLVRSRHKHIRKL